MNTSFKISLARLAIAAAFFSCASSDPGDTKGTGGQSATGTGGGTGSGGFTSGTGGSASGSGGSPGSGGSAATGGSTGGSGGAGGATATGGSPGSGGSTGGGSGGQGGSGVGGASGAGGASGGGGKAGAGGSAGSGGPFVLAWQDDFNTLDTSAWQLESFTFAGNEAQFTPQNASVAGGILTIKLTANPSSTTEPYFGVEMRSAKTLTYGKVSARMRFATGSGVVSGLVLFYTPYPNCNWNEIDIEHLGDSSNSSQLNCQVYLGTPMASCTTSVSPTQDPEVVDLGVNAETDFHQYDIEWTPSGVSTYVDGKLLRTWTAHANLLTLPETILFTIWASSSASWAGPLTSTSAPTSADIDWIRVYSWTGTATTGGG